MASGDVEQFFTYEARLTSFQKVTKKRASSASRAPKVLNWPHKQISPASLARAGFFFRPTPESIDNTVCFLCQKGLDGWEAGDDPLLEHLKHSPQCGWAICAAIEVEVGDLVREDPSKPEMIDARTATFAGRWPHDAKKGWKCKTRQLVEAGWKYTPTEDSDDMATCAYCQLALDGWEPNDKPFDEHINRSPHCPFFSLLEQFKGVAKGRARAAKARSSSQSIVSEIASLADLTTGPDESESQLGAKKSRTKRATASKATRKKAAKAEDSIMTTEESQQADNGASQPSQPKARRGRKRRSEAVESTVASTTDGPAPKKRTGQSPISMNETSSPEEDDEMTDASAPKAGGAAEHQFSNQQEDHHSPRAHPRSPSNVLAASPKPTPRNFPDDDEIERQLEEDLAKQLSDADIAHDSDSERSQSRMKKSQSQQENEGSPASSDHKGAPNYAMIDQKAPSPCDKSLDDELKLLQAEMEVEDVEPQYQASKSEPRASLCQGSSTTVKSRPETALSIQTDTDLPPQDHEEGLADGENDDDGMTVGSTDTVLKKVYQGAAAGHEVRKRRSDVSVLSNTSGGEVEPPVKRGRGRPSKASLASQASAKEEETSSTDARPKRGRGRPSKASLASQDRDATLVADTSRDGDAPVKRGRGRPPKKPLDSDSEKKGEEQSEAQEFPASSEIPANPAEATQTAGVSSPVQSAASLNLPSTPGHNISPVPSARQAVLSPSHSPQSSDAENQPPLNEPPATSASMRRPALAQVAATPLHLSPSKRNVLAGLKSTTPWTAANIDAIFGTPLPGSNRENSVDQFLKGGRELTDHERKMTVEEWIYFNASEAEKKLKHECETLVSRFENEGTRAIAVLEGLEVIE